MSSPPESDPAVPPACRPTVDAVQRLLDGDGHPAEFAADPHAGSCRGCRERVRAALLVRAAFVEPAPRVVPFRRSTATILAAVALDRRTRLIRRRWSYAVGGLAAAACVAVAVGMWLTPDKPVAQNDPRPAAPREAAPTPTPPPRIDATLAEAGDALENIGRKLAAPTASAPRVFAPLADAFAAAPPTPFAADLVPAAEALADLPDAARSGFEPVTESAYQAFSYLRDMGGTPPAPKPKS